MARHSSHSLRKSLDRKTNKKIRKIQTNHKTHTQTVETEEQENDMIDLSARSRAVNVARFKTYELNDYKR